jgi:hypothetical protein
VNRSEADGSCGRGCRYRHHLCFPMWSVGKVSRSNGNVNNLNTHSIESQETPEFDAAVEVTKGNIHRNEDDIGRVAEEMSPKLDSLAENKGPCCQCDQKRLPLIGWPLLGCLVPRVEDEAVVRECPSGYCCLKDGIGAPRLGPAT